MGKGLGNWGFILEGHHRQHFWKGNIWTEAWVKGVRYAKISGKGVPSRKIAHAKSLGPNKLAVLGKQQDILVSHSSMSKLDSARRWSHKDGRSRRNLWAMIVWEFGFYSCMMGSHLRVFRREDVWFYLFL